MSVVRGKDGLFYIFDSGVWKLIACARSVSLNVSTAFIETSVSGAGRDATFAPTKNSFTGTADGVVNLNNTGMLGLPDLRSKQVAQTPLLCRYQRTDSSGNVYTDEATVYVANTTDVNSFDNVSVFNMALQGTGSLTQVFTPIVPVPVGGVLVHRYEFTTTDGQTTFTDATLINKSILEVVMDGIGDGKIITSGTPVGTEVKYISTTGQFTWAIPAADGEEGYILYQDK